MTLQAVTVSLNVCFPTANVLLITVSVGVNIKEKNLSTSEHVPVKVILYSMEPYQYGTYLYSGNKNEINPFVSLPVFDAVCRE